MDGIWLNKNGEKVVTVQVVRLQGIKHFRGRKNGDGRPITGCTSKIDEV
jgi:hypothetical protein